MVPHAANVTCPLDPGTGDATMAARPVDCDAPYHVCYPISGIETAHSILIDWEGAVWRRGDNAHGQFANRRTEGSDEPVTVLE